MEKNTKKRINKKNLTLILFILNMIREKKTNKKKEKRETLINQKKR